MWARVDHLPRHLLLVPLLVLLASVVHLLLARPTEVALTVELAIVRLVSTLKLLAQVAVARPQELAQRLAQRLLVAEHVAAREPQVQLKLLEEPQQGPRRRQPVHLPDLVRFLPLALVHWLLLGK